MLLKTDVNGESLSLYCSMSYLLIKKTTADDDDDDEGVMSCGCIQRDCPRT